MRVPGFTLVQGRRGGFFDMAVRGVYPEKGGLGSVGALGPSGASVVQRSPAALVQADDVMRRGGVTEI